MSHEILKHAVGTVPIIHRCCRLSEHGYSIRGFPCLGVQFSSMCLLGSILRKLSEPRVNMEKLAGKLTLWAEIVRTYCYH